MTPYLQTRSWKQFILCGVALSAVFMTGCTQATDVQQTPTAEASVSDTMTAVAAMSAGELLPDPALVTGTLENGLRYAILPNATPPGQAALRVQFDAGSLAEVEGTEGLAHYLEHMAFNGSKNVPEGEMIQMLERLGLSFGADTNASTGLEHTTYKLNLPKTTDEILDAAFMLMRETASNLTLDQGAIDRELGIIFSEKRTRDTASYRAWETRMRFLTPGSDTMDRLPIGTEEALRSIKSDDFQAYYDANYHPEKTLVVFVGDADPAEIEARIRDTFADWEGVGDAAPKALGSPADIEPARVAIHAEEGLTPQVSMMALRPYQDRADTWEQRNYRNIRGLAFGMLNQRLRTLSEQADRPFISASAGPSAALEITEGATISSLIQPDGWAQALSGIDTELRRALEYGFDPAELDAQVRRYDAAFAARAEGARTRPTTARMGGMVDRVLNAMGEDNIFTHPEQELERWNALKASLNVETINAVFREAWGKPNDLSVFLQLPDANGVTEAAIRNTLSESRAQPLVAPEPIVTEAFAYTDHGPAGAVISDVYLDDVDARLVTFDNNVVLAVKQTDFEEDRVTIRVDFGDGSLSSPSRNEGLRRMALAVMKESGFEEHTPDELRRMMAGRLVATTSFSNRDDADRFSLIAQTVPDDFRLQLDVFTAQLSDQAFSEKARQNHIDKLKAWYPRHDMTVDGVFSKEVKRLIYNDTRFGFDSEEQFYEPTLAEVEAWIRPELERGPAQITIIGDIDPDVVIQSVSETLATLPDRKAVTAPDSDHVAEMRTVAFPAPGDEPTVYYHRGDDNQSQLRLYWPAGDGMDPAYSRRLSVLRAVLRNRLVKEIREGEATTYSPGAGSLASTVFDDFGYVVAVLSLKPEDVDAMSAKVQTIAADLAAGNISEDEFNRALKPVVERIDSREETNGYWLSILSDAHDGARGLISHRTRRADYETMSVEDIRALANTVFDPSAMLDVRIIPNPDDS